MATFRYQGMNHEGEEVEGIVEAADELDARDQIRSQGFFVTRLDRGADDNAEPSASSASLDAQLVDLLRQARKIEAIKVHREATGAGLAEAKGYVESLARRHDLPGAEPIGCAWNAARLFVVLLLTVLACWSA